LISATPADAPGTAPAVRELPAVSHTIIHLVGLTKVFPAPTGPATVLSDINLAVQPGRIFGIIGASGAGKSTLIRCINLLERPNSDQVFVAGRELTALSEPDLAAARREIGMIF